MPAQINFLNRNPFFLILLLILPLCRQAGAQSEKTVTFSADMNTVLDKVRDKSQIGLRGSLPPLSWENDIPMKDENEDGIYTAAITFPGVTENAILEYKYLYDNVNWELEGANRVLVLADELQQSVYGCWDEPTPLSPAGLPGLSAEKLQADLSIAQKACRELHPGLYRYNTKLQIDSLFEACRLKFQSSLSYPEAYLAFSELAAGIRCGHTYANFFNQPGFIQQAVFQQPDKLPFTFRIIEGRILVEYNASEDQRIGKGCEVIAANGAPVQEILSRLARLVPADGGSLAKRMSRLELSGIGEYEDFDIFFPMLYPPSGGRYELEMRNLETGEQFSSQVDAISREARAERIRKRYGLREPSYDKLWEFALLDSQCAYLRLGHFQTWKMSADWKKFLKNVFETLESKNISHLIIDIRGNEGGNDEVILELSRSLASRPISSPPMRSLTRYATLPPGLEPYLSSWDNSFKDLSRRARQVESGFYELKSAGEQRLPGNRNAYRGKVYLLIGPSNSSATFYMAGIWKENGLAALVGQPTGGSRQGINGGQIAFLRLPHSGIELDIPLIGTFPETPQPAGGIEPDVFVRPSVEGFLKGIDSELEAAKALIRGK